ncbi:F0F1 ATP synthase subunit B [soil metagenome]
MDMNSLPPFLQVNPGLIFWTLINFSIFAFIIAKFAWKPLKEGLQARENTINEAIANARLANDEAQTLLNESKAKITSAQQEMMAIVKNGKVQAEAQIRLATEEAEAVKNQKIKEAQREIERSKDDAIKELRQEVTSLVIDATEKLIGRRLDSEDHKRIIDSSVNELSKN